MYSTNLLKQNITHKDIDTELNQENSIQYSNIVYDKLIKYQSSNNIINEDINHHQISIDKIPASSDNSIFPDSSSWYYIKDYKVYAYIKFSEGNTKYSFCYSGDKNNIKEGECN